MPVPVYWLLRIHLPTCVHWPFCPGVFIAILGLLAAIMTFWESPPRIVKVFSTALFFALMWGEVLMMSKDRDAHDLAEALATATEQQQTMMLNVLTIQVTKSNSDLAAVYRKIDAAKGNPQLIAVLQGQAAEAKKKADSASRQWLLALVPVISENLSQVAHPWVGRIALMDYYNRAVIANDDPNVKAKLRKEEQQELSRLDAKYAEQARPLMQIADNVRKQLLELLASSQTEEDKREADVFAKSPYELQDVTEALQYLRELAHRVSVAS